MEDPTLPQIDTSVLPERIGGLANPLSQDIRPLDIAKSMPVGTGVAASTSTSVPEGPGGTYDMAMAIKDQVKNPEAYASDPFYKAKGWSYDASQTGKSFDRYYAVPAVYNKIGFSPWRDNESLYNKQMSFFDDWKRSNVQMIHLAGSAYQAALPWNAWDDPTDAKSAKEMSKYNSIGASSRGGLGGYFNNLTLNAGMTVGFLGEFMTEEIGMQAAAFVATPITKGKSEGAWAEWSAVRFGKLLKDMGTLGKFGNAIGKSIKALTEIKDINKARELFNMSKIGKGVVKTFAPHTLTALTDIGKAGKAGENLGSIAKASRTFGAFYRDTREITAALSEARMEGGLAEQDLFDKLYKNHKDTHDGKAPNSDEYASMMENARNAGEETYWWNIPALYLSNKIVFDKAFRGFTPIKNIRMDFAKAVSHEITWSKALAKLGQGGYELMDKSLKATLQRMKKPSNVLRAMAKGVRTYGKANLSEGLQEIYQDALSASMKDYYEEIYKDPLKTSVHSPWGHIARNAKYQLTSKQGFETFSSGFLMGGLIQVPQHIFYHGGIQKFYEIFKGEKYDRYKTERKQEVLNIVQAMNEVTKDPTKFADIHLENLIVQKSILSGQMDAASLNNLKDYKDGQDDSDFNHIDTLLRTGHMETVIDNLKQMKKLSATELEDAYGALDDKTVDAKTFYSKKIDKFVGSAEAIKTRYDKVDKMFINPFNHYKYNPQTQKDLWKSEISKYAAFEHAKKLAVYAGHSFDETARRMKSIINKASTSRAVKNSSAHDFAITFSPKNMVDEINRRKQEVAAMKGVPGEARELAKKEKSLNVLQAFLAGVEVFRTTIGKINTRKERDETTEITEDESAAYIRAHGMMKEAYFDYVKDLANFHEESVLNNDIEDSFNDMADFYHLDNDHTNLADTINLLHNPQYFQLYSDRAAKVFQSLHEQRYELFKTSYEKVLDSQDLNDLINALIKIGVYFNPNELELLKKGERPSVLLSTQNGDRITADMDLYKQAMALFDQYKVFKETIKEEPVVAAAAETEREVAPGEVVPEGTTTRTDPVTGKTFVKESVVIPDETVSPEMKAQRKKNADAINKRINILGQRKSLLDTDITMIHDTLEYLNSLLDSTTEFAGVNVDQILDQIDKLSQIIKSKSSGKTERGQRTAARIDELKSQIRDEFSVVNDITERMRDLKEEVAQLEQIRKDLVNQLNYYNNMIADATLRTLSVSELNDRINKISKKISVLDKLVNAIKNAISKSIQYINAYFKVWETTDNKLQAFVKKTGYKELSAEKLKELLSSANEADQVQANDYAKLKAEYGRLEKEVLDRMDDVELLEDVKDVEEQRLDDIYAKLQTYQSQIRYIKELFEPIVGEVKEKLSVTPSPVAAPKPTNVKKNATKVDAAIKKEEEKQAEVKAEVPVKATAATTAEGMKTYMNKLAEVKNYDELATLEADFTDMISKSDGLTVLGITAEEADNFFDMIQEKREKIGFTFEQLKPGMLLLASDKTYKVTAVQKDKVFTKDYITGEKRTFTPENMDDILGMGREETETKAQPQAPISPETKAAAKENVDNMNKDDVATKVKVLSEKAATLTKKDVALLPRCKKH